ncbi:MULTISPECIES: AtpZ/AtpI family protein [unclassified Desulfurobacterium]|uniref:AtpZ/AtpI family protein n=1 Tax=Desulfurobacterium sp. TC5-1 TaxID=1158318 RepID=UPI0003B60D2E|nr:AtpZ/AtpI family protein [Desulfurobacterium sp. TC5-1]
MKKEKFRITQQDIKDASLSTVGLSFVFAVAIGFFIGYYLDKWLKTSPWMTVIWLLIGLAAGFKNIYLAVREGYDRYDNRKDV